jgi:hypothetical protein
LGLLGWNSLSQKRKEGKGAKNCNGNGNCGSRKGAKALRTAKNGNGNGGWVEQQQRLQWQRRLSQRRKERQL